MKRSRNPQADDGGKLAEAFLGHMVMDQRAAYLRGGRIYKDLSDDQLIDAWAKAFRDTMSLAPEAHRDEFENLSAELGIREIEPSPKLVQGELAALAKGLTEASKIDHALGLTPAMRSFLALRQRGN